MIPTYLRYRRTSIIVIAVIVSIILYLTGVLSGLYANKIIEKKTEMDLKSLEEKTNASIEGVKIETQNSVDTLQNYVDFLDLNMKSMQFEQNFVETLNHEQMCRFYSLTINDLLAKLSTYWQRLPLRIEEYEINNTLSKDYFSLKQQYTQLALRTWVVAKNKYIQCNTDLMPGLYFYSHDCQRCISQGEELDKLQKTPIGQKRVIIFTVDYDSDDPMVGYIKQYYNLTSTPAIILGEAVFQGRLFPESELRAKLAAGVNGK